VEDGGILGSGKDRIWKPRGERILVRAVSSHSTSDEGRKASERVWHWPCVPPRLC
jgi:hypothetical protein